jgi:hypothetical protein
LEPPKVKKRPKNLPPPPAQPRIIVGFDSEWTATARGENRILSWQFVVLNTDTGAMSDSFIEPDGPTRRHRIALSGGLSAALHRARLEGVIPSIPDKLTVAAHFARADLTTVRDFHAHKRRLTAVRRTYASTDIPLSLRIATPEGIVRCNVTVADTSLLTAAKTSLEKLGEDLGLRKVELPVGYSKDRMDLLLAERRDEFIKYAMTDARISALWAMRIDGIMKSLGVKGPIATLGAASVHLVEQELIQLKIDRCEFLGKDKQIRGKPQVKPNLVGAWAHAGQTYHGGLNAAFTLGLSPESRDLVDVDLKSAYTTALALIRIPDWGTARQTKNLTDLAVVDEAMTFAFVRFRFPDNARFPCLPVRASSNRGLVFPLEGESWCTGPEIVVALDQSAEVEPLSGWRIDWRAGNPIRPFEGFTRRVNEIRDKAKAAGDKILDDTAKEIGNSAYGKISQAVAAIKIIQDDAVFRRTFDTKWGRTEKLGPSAITQPMFASFCTGLVRAVICEALHRLPPDAWVASATTDGFMFAGTLGDLDTSGQIAQAFTAARKRITPAKSNIWEIKHVVPRALVMKTRGTFTVAPIGWQGDAVCAQAGYRLPGPDAHRLTELERSARWIEHYRNRDFDTRFENPSLTPLRDQHNKGLDLQTVERLMRWNADTDLKRRLVNVRDVGGLIATETLPWRTIEEFEVERDTLDMWRRSQRRVLKTAADYTDMVSWGAQHASRKSVGVRAHNCLSPLAVAALLAAIHGVCGFEKTYYNTISGIWTALCRTPVDVTKVKNTKRRGVGSDRLEGSIDRLSRADEEFAAALFRWRAETLDLLARLCRPGSEAEARVWKVFDHTMLIEQAKNSEPDPEPDLEPDAFDCAFTKPHIAAEDASPFSVNSIYSEKQSDCF